MRLILNPHFWIYFYLFSDCFVSSKVYDKRDDFDLNKEHFPFWTWTFLVLPLTVLTFLNLFDLQDGDVLNLFDLLARDVPRSPSYGVYFSQLILFARVSNYMSDFNARNNFYC